MAVDQKLTQIRTDNPFVSPLADTDLLYVVQDVGSSPEERAIEGSELKTQVKVNRNVLPNPGMRVFQRGAGPFTSATFFVNNDDAYLVDGCVNLANGSDTCDVSVVADTDFVSGNKLRFDVETANRRFGGLFPIQNADIQEIRKSGKASLQFKVKCTGTSMSNVRAYLLSWDGTSDTITSDVISSWGSAGADPTFVANWTAENTASNLSISTTIATKQITNISVDTASVKNLAVLIIVDDTDASVGDFLEIGDIKLEEGIVCTPYQNEPYTVDLLRCMFRFELVQGQTGFNALALFADTTSVAQGPWLFKTRKAATPAPAASYGFVTGGVIGDMGIRYVGGGITAATVIIFGLVTVDGTTIVVTGTGTPLTAGQGCNFRFANANGHIMVTSEL